MLRAGAGALLAPLAFWAPRSRAQGGFSEYGIDVSNWQGSVDWDTVSANGYYFAFVKCTEGTGYRDPWFPRNFSELTRVSMYRGAYHFARPGYSSGAAQADYFCDYWGPTSGDLQGVLDLEDTGGLNPSQLFSWVRSWVDRVKQRTGRPGIIYTSPYFWRARVGDPTDNLNCPLWIAHWNVSWPDVPRAWGGVWTFWQYTVDDRTYADGKPGQIDYDVCNDDSEYVLQALGLP
jgi:GH25 family lysozyme M1 (1,4-beta-N-acetylmuramidase)